MRFNPHALLSLGLLCCVGACAWTPPLDPDRGALGNVIQGEMVVIGNEVHAPGYVLLVPAATPPPPSGVGRPVSFATIRPTDFTGDAGNGVQAASWSLTNVEDGEWILLGLIDNDEDFQPLLGSNAGSTCGDQSGAYFSDITTSAFANVTVSGGQLVDDVTLLIGNTYTVERPAFQIVEQEPVGAGFYADTTVSNTGTDVFFALQTIGVHSEIIDMDGPYDPATPGDCETALWVEVVDADGDGVADEHWRASVAEKGYPAVYPRIYFEYLGDGDVPVEEGESYQSEGVPDPIGLSNRSTYPLNTPVIPTGTFFGLGQGVLPVGWGQLVLHTLPDGTEEWLAGADVPTGSYSITVVQYTGQTWALPNETAGYASTDPSFEAAYQAGVLNVVE